MIVIEGPDGAGKTMLAQKLCTLYPELRYLKPPEEVLSSHDGPQGDGTALIDWWSDELKRCRDDRVYNRTAVYDRTTYISDVVYRLAHGRRPQGTPSQMLEGIFYLVHHADLIVFCLPPWEITLENIMADGRPRLDLDEDKLYNIWWAYNYFYNLYKESAYEAVGAYDYTRGEQEWWRIKNFVGQKVLGMSFHDTIGRG